MKKEFKNFIKALQNIKLSDEERAVLRSKISEFISFNPIRGKIGLAKEKNYLSIFEVRHFLKATALVLILAVVAGGTGISYAASNSLPGDRLYVVKIAINEGIEKSLAISPEAKVEFQSKKVEKRLEEAQILVKENKLSNENKKIVEDNLQKHISELSTGIEGLKKDGNIESILETTGKLTPVLQAHKEILEKNNAETKPKNDDTQDTTSLIAKVEAGIQEVKNQENSIIDDVNNVEELNTEAETMTLTTAKESVETPEKDPEEEALKEAKKQLKVISDRVEDVVKSRIRTAQEKIRIIKAEEERLAEEMQKSEETAKPASQTPETLNPEQKDASLSKTTSTIPETKISTDLTSASPATKTEIATPVSSTVKVAPDTFDTGAKIKEAESLIKQAEDFLAGGKFKEALAAAQAVNKIASEIETHKKLKILELAEKNTNKETQTANVSVSLGN